MHRTAGLGTTSMAVSDSGSGQAASRPRFSQQERCSIPHSPPYPTFAYLQDGALCDGPAGDAGQRAAHVAVVQVAAPRGLRLGPLVRAAAQDRAHRHAPLAAQQQRARPAQLNQTCQSENRLWFMVNVPNSETLAPYRLPGQPQPRARRLAALAAQQQQRLSCAALPDIVTLKQVRSGSEGRTQSYVSC